MEDVAVSENVFAGSVLPLGVDKVENIVAVLKIHCQTFKTVCNFSGNRLAFQAADLLEVCELSHFHTVHPNFPA